MLNSPKPSTADATAEQVADNEYTIDELARVAATTVRNVRAYQDRDLLMPPEKRGRVGIYNDSHVARLKLINHLLARGYTLSNIQDLIKAIDDGGDLCSILGLENAIGGRWTHERPKTYSIAQLVKMFGAQAPGHLSRLADLGLIERHGISFVSRNPAMLNAAAATVREGIPARELLDVLAQTRPHFDEIARVLVEMVVRHLDRYDAGALPPPTEMPGLVDAIWRLRPLSTVFVESEILRALEDQSSAYLGGRVATILDKTLSGRGSRDAQTVAPAKETSKTAAKQIEKQTEKHTNPPGAKQQPVARKPRKTTAATVVRTVRTPRKTPA